MDTISKWPQAISPNLWPYTIRTVQHNLNNTPSMKLKGRLTPLEALTGAATNHHIKVAIPFGCPIYPVKTEIALSMPYGKWLPRSRRAVYIGPSPLHTRIIALALSPTSGLLSPQYHVADEKISQQSNPSRDTSNGSILLDSIHRLQQQ